MKRNLKKTFTSPPPSEEWIEEIAKAGADIKFIEFLKQEREKFNVEQEEFHRKLVEKTNLWNSKLEEERIAKLEKRRQKIQELTKYYADSSTEPPKVEPPSIFAIATISTGFLVSILIGIYVLFH